MAKRCLFLLALTLPLIGRAQASLDGQQHDILGKGHFDIGVSIGQGFRGTYPTTTSISPRIQYFITDGWSIAAEGRYLQTNLYHRAGNKPDYTLWGGGLSTRYYFLRGKRLAIFAYAGAVYGKTTFDLYPDTPYYPVTFSTAWQKELGLGVHYRLGKRWSIEAMGSRSWLHNLETFSYATSLPTDFNRWQFSVGLVYHLK